MSKKEMQLISDIADIAIEKYNIGEGKLSLMMDIDYAHQDCPLDLERLKLAGMYNVGEEGNLYDFLHDICGIIKNLNRETKKLDNCFVPRFAKPGQDIEIEVEEYIIEEPGDMSVGINPAYYSIKGDFVFQNKEDKEYFEMKIKEAFEVICDPLILYTDKEIRR